jgi:hypothetical protein
MAFGLSNITYVNIARGRRSINLPCLGRDCNCKNGERILRFMMTLSMPSFSNNLVHQVICDHDSTSLQEFTELLNDTDFVTVHQYYNVKDEASGERDWEYKGELTINTSLISAALSGLNAANFATFVQTLISTYFTATASTQMPTTFVIPYSDFLGLQTMTPNVIGAGEGTFPISKLDFLLRAFKAATQNPNFEIKPLAYCDKENNSTRINVGTGKQCYILFNKDPESIRMDIPVDYTTTQPNSVNNFQFQNVGYGQYTGVGVYRNLEVLYFQF